MERHFELGFLLKMAGVAKFGLRLDQQKLLGRGVVRGMTRDTAHVALGMQGIYGLHMLGAGRVAGHAAIINFFGGMVFEDENLGDIAGAGDMGRSGTMAPFASLMGWPAIRVQCRLPVRGLFPIVVKVLVARLARIRPDVAGIIRRRGSARALPWGRACKNGV